MNRAIHCFISGHVQGVCFRMETQKQALLHQITGWVRNLEDGRVEVYACGQLQQLAELQKWLAHGPDQAQVLNFECNFAAYIELTDFEIRS